MRIFLNAGHDSKRKDGKPIDSGAVNEVHNVNECDVCKIVADEVKSRLTLLGIEVISEQDDDLQSIVVNANTAKADLFISIHCNAFNTHAYGTEVWYYPSSQKGRKLAQCVYSHIVRRCGTYERGIKESKNLYVLKHTEMPAILVELAFIDNESDFTILSEHPELFAMAIADGIEDYLK